MISESYHGAYLFIDCDNPSIFSTITKNHIVIFVCYKPYLGFLDMISWLRAILTAPSIVPSRKPSLDHYFRQLDMNCLIGIRHFQFQVDQRSMWGGNLSWFKNILFDFFLWNLSKIFSWKWNSNQSLPSRTWTSVCIMIQGSPSHGMSRSKQPFVLTRGLGTWGMTFWTRVIKITDKLRQNSNSKKLKQKIKKDTKNDKI